MYTTVTCKKVDKRNCLMMAKKGEEKLEIQFKIPFLKTGKNIWKFVHMIKKFFTKKDFI